MRRIGVFDSGVGGLTVLKALRRVLPGEDMVYLGDTARLPYGTKSADTIRRYAQQAAELLFDYGINHLVIACNTASAHAVEYLQDCYPEISITGVIGAGSRLAVERSRNHHIAVIGTEATIAAGAYEKSIQALAPHCKVSSRACTLMVGLAEEGWLNGVEAEAVIRRYLEPIFNQAHKPDSLVLGCTHFPLLADIIQQIVGADIILIDSAEAIARQLQLESHHIGQEPAGKIRLLATDSPQRFARVAKIFLPELAITADQIELVDLNRPMPLDSPLSHKLVNSK